MIVFNSIRYLMQGFVKGMPFQHLKFKITGQVVDHFILKRLEGKTLLFEIFPDPLLLIRCQFHALNVRSGFGLSASIALKIWLKRCSSDTFSFANFLPFAVRE